MAISAFLLVGAKMVKKYEVAMYVISHCDEGRVVTRYRWFLFAIGNLSLCKISTILVSSGKFRLLVEHNFLICKSWELLCSNL